MTTPPDRRSLLRGAVVLVGRRVASEQPEESDTRPLLGVVGVAKVFCRISSASLRPLRRSFVPHVDNNYYRRYPSPGGRGDEEQQ